MLSCTQRSSTMNTPAAVILTPSLSVWDAARIANLKESDAKLVGQALDEMGKFSSQAQGLHSAITSMEKLKQNYSHRVYIMCELAGKRILGFLKLGRKHLFLYGVHGNKLTESDPLCVLDFYVQESVQREGIGLKIFKHVLENEQVKPTELAFDRPSKMLRSFLARHFGLYKALDQPNRFVIFYEFWHDEPSGGMVVET